MFTRRHGKSDIQKTLQGMDFGKLEQTALKISNGEYVTFSSPTGRNANQRNAFNAMIDSLQRNLTGTLANTLWGDELVYTPPPPHLKTKVDEIIDDFWEHPELGIVHLYLRQLRKNPVTKDLFKGESTTHHYPWYKRGTKY